MKHAECSGIVHAWELPGRILGSCKNWSNIFSGLPCMSILFFIFKIFLDLWNMTTHILNAQLIVYWVMSDIVLTSHIHKHIRLEFFTKVIQAPGCWCGILKHDYIQRNNCWLVSKHFRESCLIIQKPPFTKVTNFNDVTTFKRIFILGVPLRVLVDEFWSDTEDWLLLDPDLIGVENN